MGAKIDQSQRLTIKLVVYTQKKQLPIIGKTKAGALLFKGIVQASAKLYIRVAVGKFVHVATYNYPMGTCQGVLVQKFHLTGSGFKPAFEPVPSVFKALLEFFGIGYVSLVNTHGLQVHAIHSYGIIVYHYIGIDGVSKVSLVIYYIATCHYGVLAENSHSKLAAISVSKS